MARAFDPFLWQLLSQTPVLLAYVAGMLAALMFWQRCPGSARLTFIGMALLLAATLVGSFLSMYLLQARDEFGWSIQELGAIMAVITIIANIIRAVAYGLVLAAVFINRKGNSPSSVFE